MLAYIAIRHNATENIAHLVTVLESSEGKSESGTLCDTVRGGEGCRSVSTTLEESLVVRLGYASSVAPSIGEGELSLLG